MNNWAYIINGSFIVVVLLIFDFCLWLVVKPFEKSRMNKAPRLLPWLLLVLSTRYVLLKDKSRQIRIAFFFTGLSLSSLLLNEYILSKNNFSLNSQSMLLLLMLLCYPLVYLAMGLLAEEESVCLYSVLEIFKTKICLTLSQITILSILLFNTRVTFILDIFLSLLFLFSVAASMYYLFADTHSFYGIKSKFFGGMGKFQRYVFSLSETLSWLGIFSLVLFFRFPEVSFLSNENTIFENHIGLAVLLFFSLCLLWLLLKAKREFLKAKFLRIYAVVLPFFVFGLSFLAENIFLEFMKTS